MPINSLLGGIKELLCWSENSDQVAQVSPMEQNFPFNDNIHEIAEKNLQKHFVSIPEELQTNITRITSAVKTLDSVTHKVSNHDLHHKWQ
jgi:hypothetical protein